MADGSRTAVIPLEGTSMPTSTTSLISRVRRKLAKHDERLVKASARWAHPYGPYFIVDANNLITSYGWEPEELARHLGLIS
jgi:hypothetical protein